MTLLKKVGSYEIHSEMVEKCLPYWSEICGGIGFIGTCISILFLLWYISVDSISASIYCGFVAIMCFGLMFLPFKYRKCGIKIYFYQIHESGGNTKLDEATYQFTSDAQQNIIAIQNIVNKFVIKANDLLVVSEKEKNSKHQCCDQYKLAIQGIKKD